MADDPPYGSRFPASPFVVPVDAAAKPPPPRSHRRSIPMRYLLLIYNAESTDAVPQAEMFEQMNAYDAFTRDIAERGIYRAGEALQPTSTATTVRVRDGRTLTTDGPFAETKEQLGGFYVVEAKDLDEAIEAAARIPGAWIGSVEVRPIWDMPTGRSADEVAATAGVTR
jgi:hypothetical protein